MFGKNALFDLRRSRCSEILRKNKSSILVKVVVSLFGKFPLLQPRLRRLSWSLHKGVSEPKEKHGEIRRWREVRMS